MVKVRKSARQWSRPFTVEALAAYGGLNFQLKADSFEPDANWEQVWQIWLLKPNQRMHNHHGFVRLRKIKENENSGFILKVEQQVINFYSLAVQQAEISCACDLWATPRYWKITFDLFPFGDSHPIRDVHFEKSGSYQNGRLHISSGGQNFKKLISPPLTSNWSFMEALQRFAATESHPVPQHFTMLDELDKIKENQTLTFRERKTILVGKQNVPVLCYQLTGTGWLPWFFYIDLKGRLLVAINGLRAYVLNPDTLSIHREEVSRLRER